MKNPEQLDMGVIVLEQSDEAFEKIYNKLDAYAAKIGGVAWLSDEIFDVEASKLIKYPTSSRGIFKRDHFATRIFEFTASKYPTEDQDDPFFNVFQLAETHSVPLELCKTAPEHRLGLFKHFMEYLPGLMQESLKTLVLQDGDTLEDGDTLNIENIDNDVLLDACDLVVEEMGIDVKLGRTIMYTILERGQSIQYSESNF